MLSLPIDPHLCSFSNYPGDRLVDHQRPQAVHGLLSSFQTTISTQSRLIAINEVPFRVY